MAMANKRTIVKSMLAEPGSDDWSSKRIIGFLGALSLIIMMYLCPILDLKEPPQSVVNAVEFISITCMLGVAAEKFAELRNSMRSSIQYETKIQSDGPLLQQQNLPQTDSTITKKSEENEA